MNIMIDEKLHDMLIKHKLATVMFGGRAKGSQNGDVDLLHIIPDFHLVSLLPYNNKHLLQFSQFIANGDKISDHIYMTLSQLVHSVANGDNMFIIEIVLSSLFDKKYLSKIENNDFMVELFSGFKLSDFCTFNILRGLIGLAERDLKQIEYKKDFSLKDNKKFRFVKESLYYFFKLNDDNYLYKKYVNLNNEADSLIFYSYDDYISFRGDYESLLKALRLKINSLSATNKTLSIELSLNIMEKISIYTLINDSEINKMLHNIYYNGIKQQ